MFLAARSARPAIDVDGGTFSRLLNMSMTPGMVHARARNTAAVMTMIHASSAEYTR
jgi:hypothetical protein